MVMNVYRQMNRSDLQFDFLLKEKVNDGYEQEVKALGGHIFMLKPQKNRREKLHKKCEGRYRTEWPLLRGTFSYECNVRLDYVLGLVVGNQSSHKPQS